MITAKKAIALYHDANAFTLGLARVYLFLIWFGYLSFLEFANLGYLSYSLFHKQGVLKFIPDALLMPLLTPTGLVALQLAALWFVARVIIGLKRQKWDLFIALVLITSILGIAKGFGGHVDHRELVLLYVSYLMLLMPVYDAVVLHWLPPPTRAEGVYRASMLIMVLVVVVQYFFIGLARTAIGFPGVFDPSIMQAWIIDRCVRPNPLGFTSGLDLLQHSWFVLLLTFALPLSTILELLSPLVFWLRGVFKAILILSLAAFHLSILLLMNIPFTENVLLLLLMVNYTVPATRVLRTTVSKGVVFFDGDCSLCSSFVRFVISRDRNARFSFAPLGGKTSREKGIVAKENNKGKWESIMFYEEETHQTLERADAVMAIARGFRFPWPLLVKIIGLVPARLRTVCYNFVAQIRYPVFGDITNCPLPTEEEAKRMLP